MLLLVRSLDGKGILGLKGWVWWFDIDILWRADVARIREVIVCT